MCQPWMLDIFQIALQHFLNARRRSYGSTFLLQQQHLRRIEIELIKYT